MAFKACPQLGVHLHRNKKPVNVKIEKAFGCLIQDGMYLQISKILFGGGKLDELRPSFEASLGIGSKDSCFAEMPLEVLPGDICSVKLSNSELDNCLRPGDVIHELKLQVLDAYENPVEKGQKIKVELTGLQFQFQEFQDHDDPYQEYREVDDQGLVNFGGLLKVTGSYGSKGCIRVSSDTKDLLIKEFDLLSRELKVVSGIPEHAYAGSILENVVFGIFDDERNIDSMMNGCHHTLTVDLCPLSSVQYTFIQGKCTVPRLQLPQQIGLLEFKAFHSWHTELFVRIKVDILPNPLLEMVSIPKQPLDDGAVCHAYNESTASQPQIRHQITVNQVNLYVETSLREIEQSVNELKQLGVKIRKHEDKLRKLEANKNKVNNFVSDLESISLDGGMLSRTGVIECGNRDKVAVRFPTNSAKTSPFSSAKTMPTLDTEGKIIKKKEEKEMLEKKIYRARDNLERLKKDFENKKKEIDEREVRITMFMENVQQQGFIIGEPRAV